MLVVLQSKLVLKLKNIGSYIRPVIRSFLDRKECKKMQEKLDYCNVLPYRLPHSTLEISQRVQKMLGMTTALHDLHWLPVDMWIVYTISFHICNIT